jgi:hypothetical protein
MTSLEEAGDSNNMKWEKLVKNYLMFIASCIPLWVWDLIQKLRNGWFLMDFQVLGLSIW